MTEVIECGFARVAARQSTYTSCGAVQKDKNKSLEFFTQCFNGASTFKVDKKIFFKKVDKIVFAFKQWRLKDKDTYLHHFSLENWRRLPEIQKLQHSVRDCKACKGHHYPFQKLFPMKSPRAKSLHPLQNVTNVNTTTI